MSVGGSGGKFSALLLEGLDHYRKGRMIEAVRAWEEAYLLEPTNLRAREFLRSALERIHAHMGPGAAGSPAPAAGKPAETPGAAGHPWLPQQPETLPKRPPAGAAPPASRPAPAATPGRGVPPVPSPAESRGVDARAQTAASPARPAEGARSGPRPPAANPWDDGPSLAIPQPEDPGDVTGAAWSIHKEPLPIAAVAGDETEVWMRGAHELVALNDFSGALELLGKVLERKAGDKDAQQLHDLCEQNLTSMFESKIGAMEARPRIAIPPDEIIWLNLDPRAGFVLAQIDGEVSFEDLYAICGLKRLDLARILCQLLEEGVVEVKGRDQAVAKRAMHRS